MRLAQKCQGGVVKRGEVKRGMGKGVVKIEV
jgi:hypothetical protein